MPRALLFFRTLRLKTFAEAFCAAYSEKFLCQNRGHVHHGNILKHDFGDGGGGFLYKSFIDESAGGVQEELAGLSVKETDLTPKFWLLMTSCPAFSTRLDRNSHVWCPATHEADPYPLSSGIVHMSHCLMMETNSTSGLPAHGRSSVGPRIRGFAQCCLTYQ